MKTLRFRTLQKPRIIRCGFREKLFFNSTFPYCFTWVNYNTSADIVISNINTVIKFKIYSNGVLIEETPYIGNVTRQNELSTYLHDNFLSDENIVAGTTKTFHISVNSIDTIDIKMYAPLDGNSPSIELNCDES